MLAVAGPGPGQSQELPGDYMMHVFGLSSTALPDILAGNWVGGGASKI